MSIYIMSIIILLLLIIIIFRYYHSQISNDALINVSNPDQHLIADDIIDIDSWDNNSEKIIIDIKKINNNKVVVTNYDGSKYLSWKTITTGNNFKSIFIG